MPAKRICLFLFLFLFLLHLVGIAANQQFIQSVSKPLIIPGLAIYFIVAAKDVEGSFKRVLLGALLFSWIGDVLLLFQEKDQLFFLLGLSSFLFAHVFYIVCFNGLRREKAIRPRLPMIAAVLIYYVTLLLILSPHLGEMKWPVRMYGLVISCMLVLSIHMIFLPNKTAGWLILAGGSLFVISDSVLAINKFVMPVTAAGLIIMLTYGMAQWFIVEGLLRERTGDLK